MNRYHIAVIPGDGVGKAVVPEGIRAIRAAGEVTGRYTVETTEYPWSCAWYLEHGEMMPADGIDRLRDSHAIYLGAVGFPGVPDHVSLWGLLLPIRFDFDQFVNKRPVRLFEGSEGPSAAEGLATSTSSAFQLRRRVLGSGWPDPGGDARRGRNPDISVHPPWD